jgi:hypothetical protein
MNVEGAIDESAGLQMISIRLQKPLIEDFKANRLAERLGLSDIDASGSAPIRRL